MMAVRMPQSFRGKLLLLVLLTTLAAVFTQSAILRVNELLDVKPTALTELSMDASVIATHSQAALAFNDPGVAQETLGALAATPRVLSATLFDSAGSAFATYSRTEGAPVALEPMIEDHRFDGQRLILSQPVQLDGVQLGSLSIVYDLSGYYARIRQNILVTLCVAFGSLCISMLAAMRLQRGLTGPVRELVGAAHTIAHSKDYSLRVPRQKDDELGQLVNSFNDMLETIETRDADLVAAQRSLKTSNEQLEQFAYVASHDLQEPLRKIQTFSSMLKDDFGEALPDEAGDYINRMEAAATRMRGLVSDLLTFSRVSSKEPDMVDVDLNAIVDGVLSDLEIRLAETGGQVHVGSLPVVCADELHMRQIFQNLIGNALKFHRPDEPPVVSIAAKRVRSGAGRCTWELTLVDNGIGFEQQFADRIFLPFQRLHGRNEYEGTGMGLAVCRRIVERYGWSIGVTSQPGVGTTFTITASSTAVGAGEQRRPQPGVRKGVAA